MKVVHVVEILNQGGAERVLFNLLSRMDREHFEPVVVSLLDGGTQRGPVEALGVPVYALGMTNLSCVPKSIWRLVKIIRAERPQLIQGWTYYGSLAATIAAALTPGSRTLLWSIHHTVHDIKQEKRQTAMAIRLGALLSSRPAHIVYCARASARDHEALGYNPAQQSVIPNGFDLKQFTPSGQARTSVRSELGISDATPLVGVMARFHPMKDHANFLMAAAILASRRPDIHFLMCGRGVDADNDSIMRLISSNGLSPLVHLLGERRDVPRLMAALDIMCCSSAWGEAFPLVIGEAMACGVPCVTTDIGDGRWIVGDTGRVVPPRDPEALAEGWEAILNMDGEARLRLGAQARERIEQNFPLPTMVHAYEQLYEAMPVSHSN